jgi:hypothetical protein
MNQSQALALIETPPLSGGVESVDLESLSRVLDYGWLSDASRSNELFPHNHPKDTGLVNWSIFDDTVGAGNSQSLDIIGHSTNPFCDRSGKAGEWWFDIDNGDIDAF